MDDRELFSESEIADLVRRAAELQEAGSAKGYVPGVTRDELTRMAQEAGIDPAFMLQAIEEKRTGNPDKPAKFQWKRTIERVLPVEVSPDNFDIITEDVKVLPATNVKGVVSGGLTQLGRTIEGQLSRGWDNPSFRITSRGGRTSLKLESTLNSACIGLLGLFPLLMSPIVAEKGSVLGAAVMAITSVVGSWLAARYFAGKATQDLEVAANSLEKGIMSAAAETEQVRARLAGNVLEPESDPSESTVSVRDALS